MVFFMFVQTSNKRGCTSCACSLARTRGISHLVFLFTRRDVVVVVVEVGASLALRWTISAHSPPLKLVLLLLPLFLARRVFFVVCRDSFLCSRRRRRRDQSSGAEWALSRYTCNHDDSKAEPISCRLLMLRSLSMWAMLSPLVLPRLRRFHVTAPARSLAQRRFSRCCRLSSRCWCFFMRDHGRRLRSVAAQLLLNHILIRHSQ